MKHVALAAFAGALACCAVTVSSQAAPVSGVANLAATSQASSLSITCAAAAAATITVHCSGVAAIVVGGGN